MNDMYVVEVMILSCNSIGGVEACCLEIPGSKQGQAGGNHLL